MTQPELFHVPTSIPWNTPSSSWPPPPAEPSSQPLQQSFFWQGEQEFGVVQN